MEQNKTKAKSRILKFEQTGEYYNRRALRQIEKSDLWGALASLRVALEKEPDSARYSMNTAEILAQMGLYELSNDMLFANLISGTADAADCYFALANNFFALRMPRLCQDCIAGYLRLLPDGELKQDCEDMLYMLGEETRGDELAPAAVIAAEDGKRALDEGRYLEAIQKLSNALEVDPTLAYARGNLAFAYYCAQETDRAIAEAGKVLKENEYDVFALCSMAIFQKGKGRKKLALQYIKKAEEKSGLDDDEIYKLCITSAELGLHEEAISYSSNILKYSPYDENVLYLHALSQYNAGNYPAAHKTITRLLLLEPESAVYRYVASATSAKTSGISEKTPPKSAELLEYTFALPALESIKRLESLHRFISNKDHAQSERRLEEDGDLRANINWCFSLENTDVKYDLAMYLGCLKTKRAMMLLMEQLLSIEQRDDFKKTLVLAIHTQGLANPPYQAIIAGSLAEIRLRHTNGDPGIATRTFDRVAKRAIADETLASNPYACELAMRLWMHLIVDGEGAINLRGEHSWTASLIYAALTLSGAKPDPAALARQYRTRRQIITDRFLVFDEIYKKFAKDDGLK